MAHKPEPIKIACYNILADAWVNPCKPMFAGCWDTRKVELVDRICNLNADIFSLQEVDRFNDLAHLLFKRGYIGYRVTDKDVAIFYKSERFKVLEEKQLHYPDAYWRSALLLKLQCVSGGTAFNVISTHVTWRQPEDVLEMNQLQEFIAEQKDPVILCGDLNATPDWAPLQNLSKMGFCDSLRHSTKKTYIDEHRRLDYIFVPHQIHVRSADVDGITSELKIKKEPSDHLPILAEILIPSNLQTINPQKPDTLSHQLFEALNDEMKAEEHSQQEYDTAAAVFVQLLKTMENESSKNFLEALLVKLEAPEIKEHKGLLDSAIRRYERTCLQKIISFLQMEKQDEALLKFSELSYSIRKPVYYSVYEIEKRHGRQISHFNFGEAAFHQRDHLDISNMVRSQAIERCLLRETYALLKANKENAAFPLFESLSASLRDLVYGETYAAAHRKGLCSQHSDFGKVAFHRIEKHDLPNDLRQDAIASYLSKTSA